ncbi:MAG: hypothetical protein RLY35_195, partial [Bacteroidota bacterium]
MKVKWIFLFFAICAIGQVSAQKKGVNTEEQ